MTVKREPLMDQYYFDRMIAYQTGSIKEFEELLAKSPNPKSITAYSIFRKRFNLLIELYSKGEDISAIKNELLPAIESLKKYLLIKGQISIDIAHSIDDYITSLWLVSLGLIFKIDNEDFNKLINCFGGAGQDAFLDKLISTRIPHRLIGHNLLWPEPYKLLSSAIDAKVEDKPLLVEKFLKIWYQSMGKLGVYWYGTDKKGNGGFIGYWSVETAGVVYAFHIDDRQFRELPYYPKDLLQI